MGLVPSLSSSDVSTARWKEIVFPHNLTITQQMLQPQSLVVIRLSANACQVLLAATSGFLFSNLSFV